RRSGKIHARERESRKKRKRPPGAAGEHRQSVPVIPVPAKRQGARVCPRGIALLPATIDWAFWCDSRTKSQRSWRDTRRNQCGNHQRHEKHEKRTSRRWTQASTDDFVPRLTHCGAEILVFSAISALSFFQLLRVVKRHDLVD